LFAIFSTKYVIIHKTYRFEIFVASSSITTDNGVIEPKEIGPRVINLTFCSW